MPFHKTMNAGASRPVGPLELALASHGTPGAPFHPRGSAERYSTDRLCSVSKDGRRQFTGSLRSRHPNATARRHITTSCARFYAKPRSSPLPPPSSSSSSSTSTPTTKPTTTASSSSSPSSTGTHRPSPSPSRQPIGHPKPQQQRAKYRIIVAAPMVVRSPAPRRVFHLLVTFPLCFSLLHSLGGLDGVLFDSPTIERRMVADDPQTPTPTVVQRSWAGWKDSALRARWRRQRTQRAERLHRWFPGTFGVPRDYNSDDSGPDGTRTSSSSSSLLQSATSGPVVKALGPRSDDASPSSSFAFSMTSASANKPDNQGQESAERPQRQLSWRDFFWRGIVK